MADPVVPPPKAERQTWTGKERLSTNRNPLPPVVPLPEQPAETAVPMHTPVIVTDGGPWVLHDYACPVCQIRKAVLDLNNGRFLPCDYCGQWWELRYRSRFFRRVFRRYS